MPAGWQPALRFPSWWPAAAPQKKEVGHVILADMPHRNNLYLMREAFSLQWFLLQKTLQVFGRSFHIQEDETQLGLGARQNGQDSVFANRTQNDNTVGAPDKNLG